VWDGATAAAMGTHFFGGLRGGFEAGEGRKRPAWPAELGGHRTRRPLPRPGRSRGDHPRAWDPLSHAPSRAYI